MMVSTPAAASNPQSMPAAATVQASRKLQVALGPLAAQGTAVAISLGLAKPLFFLGDRIGLTGPAVREKQAAFVSGRHARNAANEAANWLGSAAMAVSGTATGVTALLANPTTPNTDQTGIHKMDIKTQAGAWESLQRIDSALDKVSSARAELGAIQTRFEKSIENIDIQQENISAARGRITDADFAQETANLSRTQILQQAGTAMVAQANQLPQQVLQLLQ